MPGKVNPVLPEATLMVCAQVIGNDAAIAWAGAAGNFELNVMMPVIARNLIDAIRLLGNASRVLAGRCVDGITRTPTECARMPLLTRHRHPPRAADRLRGCCQGRQGMRWPTGVRSATVLWRWATSSAGEPTEADLDAALDIAAMTRGAD